MSDPLATISRDTVYSLVDQVRLYIDPITHDYKSTPPERAGGMSGDGYVSGTDVEKWPGRVARFRDKWEARPENVRAAILARAFPHQ